MTHLYASFFTLLSESHAAQSLMTLIKSQYVEAYNYSLIGCEMLKEKHHLAINDDDIGYIALHLRPPWKKDRAAMLCRTVIVCGSGIGTSS